MFILFTFFSHLDITIMEMVEISYPLAFMAGIVSFISPCVLPLIPSYLSYITGISFEELTNKASINKV